VKVSTLAVGAIVVLCSAGLLAAVLVALFRPGDSTELIVTILGFVAPTVAALLAILRVESVHVAVNSRLSELVETTGEAARAVGELEGRAASRRESGVGSQGPEAWVSSRPALPRPPTPDPRLPREHAP
jgi:hypothetical protein